MRPAWVYWVVGTGVAALIIGPYTLVVEAISMGATPVGFGMGAWGAGLTLFGLLFVATASPPNPMWS